MREREMALWIRQSLASGALVIALFSLRLLSALEPKYDHWWMVGWVMLFASLA